MSLSTRDLSGLGDPEQVRALVRAQAVLTALLDPVSPEIRYLARPEGGDLASYNNGQGDDLLLLFAPEGALIRGFDHESPFSPYDEDVAFASLSDSAYEELSEEETEAIRAELRPLPGVLDEVPERLRERLFALDTEDDRPVPVPSVLTFCVWRAPADARWRVGSQIAFPGDHDDPDGSAFLLALLERDPTGFQAWAEANYARRVAREVVEAVYAGQLMTPALAEALSPGVSLEPALKLLRAAGYEFSG